MTSKQWENLIKEEFGVSGSLAGDMYHAMLRPYKLHINLYGMLKCKYYRMMEYGEDYCVPVCMAQKGMPRTHCDGLKEKCWK